MTENKTNRLRYGELQPLPQKIGEVKPYNCDEPAKKNIVPLWLMYVTCICCGMLLTTVLYWFFFWLNGYELPSKRCPELAEIIGFWFVLTSIIGLMSVLPGLAIEANFYDK